jgi:dihydropteroate synthase
MQEWHLTDRTLTIGRRPLVMGIVNVTPDSFSDGGQFFTVEAAISHGLALVRQGADLLDIGGESTRPGAAPVPAAEELRRVLPVVEALAKQVRVPLSVDTSKAEVARCCLQAGAHILNDVTALSDPDMAAVVHSAGAGIVLMHMQGTPATMQDRPTYVDVVGDIGQFLETRLQLCRQIGIAAAKVAIDPGIGFGKTDAHNLEILARLAEFQKVGRPVCLGVSRKGFIGRLRRQTAPERLYGSLAVVCHAVVRGAAQIVRVHDVAPTVEALEMLAAIAEFPSSP